jgi:IMP dehydrogenase
MKTALSFDDILLVPRMSEIESRKDVDLSSVLKYTDYDESLDLLTGYEFSLPIISSPMDTVTGRDMMRAMHHAGGLGIGHRYCSIEEQVEMVRPTISHPYKKKEEKMDWDKVKSTSSLHPFMKMKEVYVDLHHSPRAKALNTGVDDLVQDYKEYSHTAAAAIGVTGDFLERAQELVKAECKILCIDVAHGHHISVKKALKKLKKQFGDDVVLIAGNVATARAFEHLSDWGADAIRVGIGGGSICSTRIQTGHGVPTLQSVMDCAESEGDAKIIADGGIRNAGDIVKCLAAGADFVMLGSLLAGTDQTPGQVFTSAEGNKYKVYRGMASAEAQIDWRGKAKSLEGVSTTIPWKGSVKKILKDLEQNIRSGLSYSGATSIDDLYNSAKFIKQTQAGLRESFTHILSR